MRGWSNCSSHSTGTKLCNTSPTADTITSDAAFRNHTSIFICFKKLLELTICASTRVGGDDMYFFLLLLRDRRLLAGSSSSCFLSLSPVITVAMVVVVATTTTTFHVQAPDAAQTHLTHRAGLQ
jgi:hypothetical protein